MLEENDNDNDNVFYNDYNIFDYDNDNDNIFDNNEFLIKPFGKGSFKSPQPPVPCFLKGTKILTTRGEILIENLLKTDYLLDNLSKPIKILNIEKFTREKYDKTHPYIIPKNTKINDYICNEDLYLSRHHAVLFNYNDFIPIYKSNFNVKNDLICNNYEYYHITSENFFTDVIMSNGIPTESYGGNLINKNNKNLVNYIYKQIRNNRRRKLLSKKEFNNILLNFIEQKPEYIKQTHIIVDKKM
jgi:hypothetical protein